MKLIVDKEEIRIDKYLSDKTEYSRELITKMLKEGYIQINEKLVKPSYKTKLDDLVEIDDSYKIEQDINPVKMSLDIVYEDKDIMVINKPSGLVVHPGNGNTNNTLVNGLMYYTNELSDLGGNERVGIVHRLDKDTSGLMLVAKSNKAHEILSDDFKNKRVYREYYALLIGNFPSDTAHIDAPIGRSKDNFNKMEVRSDGKDARTNLKVLKRYKDYTLVSLVLETGRTHQIRVHMAYVGYPIFNDPVYVNKKATEFGQLLHSKVIRFTHPITKETLVFESDLPKEFQEYIDKLD
ncbi:MAG: RluA family pseudouridine synthase [Firmicutes bacterium]|nr:RluA family pseudouridine synthase [Bacillota bacterium]